MSSFSKVGARLLRASFLLDRAYLLLDRARAALVTAFASDALLAAYNDLAYGATPAYDAGTQEFREKLFNWEADLVRRIVPKAPGRVLVGGAGGGREAFQLAAMGYAVTAFEPSPTLTNSMLERARSTAANVEVLLGRYEELPVLRVPNDGASCDLSQRPPFDAAILGWSSYSHIRSGSVRSATLRAFGEITDGPVVASVFLRPDRQTRRPRYREALATLGRRREGDAFTAHIGFYHLSSQAELAEEARAAGLEIVAASYDQSDGHWPWIAVARPQVAARLRSAGGAG